MKTLVRQGLLLVVLCGLYAISYQALLTYRSDHGVHRQRSVGWNLPPVVLKVLAGEFKGLMADLIVLEAGAQLGTEVVRNPQGGFRVVN